MKTSEKEAMYAKEENQERLIPKMIASNAERDSQSNGDGEEPMSSTFRLIPKMIQEKGRKIQMSKVVSPSAQNTNTNRSQNIPMSQSDNNEDENEYHNDDSMVM